MTGASSFDRGFVDRWVQKMGADPVDDEAARRLVAHVVWSHLTEPGDSVAGRLVRACGAPGALNAVLSDSPWPEGFGAKERSHALKRWRPRLSPDDVEHTAALARRAGIQVVVPGEVGWPVALDDLGDHAPLCLWARGRLDSLHSIGPSLAVVGARAATAYGEQVAAEISGDLARDGVPIVSGGAYGIDGAAHRAALGVGGTTLALLAGGVERAYPSGNTELLARVRERGATMSEVPPGSAPTRWRFLQRNRLIAALADATVVVEAGWRSGSLNTAGHALAMGRSVGAVPGPVTSATSVGCHRLLREYGALCVTSSADVRELLGVPDAAPPASHGARTDDSTRVRDALSGRAWRSTEDVARRAGMMLEEVQALLGVLMLEGAVESSASGWRRTATR